MIFLCWPMECALSSMREGIKKCQTTGTYPKNTGRGIMFFPLERCIWKNWRKGSRLFCHYRRALWPQLFSLQNGRCQRSYTVALKRGYESIWDSENAKTKHFSYKKREKRHKRKNPMPKVAELLSRGQKIKYRPCSLDQEKTRVYLKVLIKR